MQHVDYFVIIFLRGNYFRVGTVFLMDQGCLKVLGFYIRVEAHMIQGFDR